MRCPDFNCHRRAGLKEADCRVDSTRRLIGVETEIIQRAKADCVGVLVLGKGFAVPGYGSVAELVVVIPGHAAITLVVKRAIVCPARLLGRRVESDVSEIGPSTQRHGKGLNTAIEILIVQGVLIVINSRRWIGHLVPHKPDPIVSPIRLDLIYRCACPSRDRREHSHGLIKRGKCEVRRAANKEVTVGSVVIHVTLPRMGLTPGILKGIQVLRFDEIGCTLIERCVQIIDVNANPVRYAVMCVTRVVGWIWIRCEKSGKRIDPCA